MIRIKVKEVLQKSEAEKHQQKPAIKIVVHRSTPTPPSIERVQKEAAIHEIKGGTKTDLLNHEWSEYKKISLDRKKLSKSIAVMVADGATKDELRSLYDKIQSLLEDGAEVYDRIQHIEQYGTLPQPAAPNVDLILLKDQRKKLVDLRCKLATKVENGEITKHKRLQQWQLDLDKANAEYLLVDEKIKKLEGKA
jgi:hypothetical protein